LIVFDDELLVLEDLELFELEEVERLEFVPAVDEDELEDPSEDVREND